jgi:cytochrome c
MKSGFALVALILLSLPGGLMTKARAPDNNSGPAAALSPPLPTQTPGSDRLAIPVLSESPTQVEVGRYLYYFHCMPCHGDRGQGLTEEWRDVWVEDHQNCWGRGCHTGKSNIEAFFIPRFVPPVIGSPRALGSFQTASDLFRFLQKTQPPQRAGALSDSEYWDLTAFLLHENDRLAPGEQIGPPAPGRSASGGELIPITLMPLLALSLALWLGRATDKAHLLEQ